MSTALQSIHPPKVILSPTENAERELDFLRWLIETARKSAPVTEKEAA